MTHVHLSLTPFSLSLIMDIGIVVAVLMLAGWGAWTFAFNAPGWAHTLLAAGVFLLIYRIVARSTAGYPSKSER